MGEGIPPIKPIQPIPRERDPRGRPKPEQVPPPVKPDIEEEPGRTIPKNPDEPEHKVDIEI